METQAANQTKRHKENSSPFSVALDVLMPSSFKKTFCFFAP